MPALPTFIVTDAVAARVLDAFSGQTTVDGTAIPPARAYKTWLRSALINHVTMIEHAKVRSTAEEDFPL